jgi:hypothetical protein
LELELKKNVFLCDEPRADCGEVESVVPSFLPATGVIECWLAGLTDDDVASSHAETAKDASVAGHD